MILGALHFPPIENIVEWPAYFGEGTIFEFNKIAIINILAVLIPTVMFLMAGSRAKADPTGVPRGIRGVAESSVEFIENGIIMQTIGKDGMRYLPLLISLFFFISFGNLFEVIPTFQMPANARMANPLFLALLVLVTFIAVGIKHNGPGYLIKAVNPPGVPFALKFLVIPIEILSTYIVRPFSLAVRLFANMLAGHILLVTFGVLCITVWSLSPLAVTLGLAFPMLVGLTGFELGVAFLQGYIFTILTGVYIGGALHLDH
ncbi:MAG: F0F1 ATP synthase subunit A [Actinomycetia bacterium]|nr:F0F1 ATP synthase subunit A [Actinomycetes bacterium]